MWETWEKETNAFKAARATGHSGFALTKTKGSPYQL